MIPISQKIAIKMYEGPSLAAPFAAVVAYIDSPYSTSLPTHQVLRLLAAAFPGAAELPLVLPETEVDFATLAAALAVAWQKHGGQITQDYIVSPLPNGTFRIAVGFFHSDTAEMVLLTGVEISNAVFALAHDPTTNISVLKPMIGSLQAALRARRIGSAPLGWLKAARALGIPVYELCPGSRFRAYGQGVRSTHLFQASNSGDSFTGYLLSKNKAVSNGLVCRLGLPGVEHWSVSDLAGAHAAAQKMGFPLVVKPIDRNGAKGVTAGIDTMAELDAAFARAKPLSESGQVLVERFVAGDDYRITVFGGKFFRASRLVPPILVGDGQRTIGELIVADNVRRRKAVEAGEYLHELVVDERRIALLRKQGLSLDARPPAGREFRLSATANINTGGALENVTREIHADNMAMAEAIARNFHLAAAGIDFITPDIATSWRDIACAIIEVNHNPGTSHELAAEVMRDRFPPGTDGRIPSVLVVGGSEDIAIEIGQRLQARGKQVGWTSSALTFLAGQRRFTGQTDLPKRILGLLLDSTCEALVVFCTPQNIERFGLPHTRFDIALIAAEDLTADMQRLIAENSTTCLHQTSMDFLPLIDRLAD